MRQVAFTLVLRTKLLELVLHTLHYAIGDTLDGKIRDESDGEFA